MKLPIHVFFGAIEVRARTKTEASAIAAERVTKALAEDCRPIVVAADGYSHFALVFRTDLEAWGYRIVDGIPTSGRMDSVNGGFDSAKSAEAAARAHLAQAALVIEDDARSGMEFLLSENERQEHLRYIAWQRSYRAIAADQPGLSGFQVHARAQSDMALVAALQARWFPVSATAAA